MGTRVVLRLDSTVLECRLAAAVLPDERLTRLREGRSETHLGTHLVPRVPSASCSWTCQVGEEEQVPWGRGSTVAATLVTPLGSWAQEVRSLRELLSGAEWLA